MYNYTVYKYIIEYNSYILLQPSTALPNWKMTTTVCPCLVLFPSSVVARARLEIATFAIIVAN